MQKWERSLRGHLHDRFRTLAIVIRVTDYRLSRTNRVNALHHSSAHYTRSGLVIRGGLPLQIRGGPS